MYPFLDDLPIISMAIFKGKLQAMTRLWWPSVAEGSHQANVELHQRPFEGKVPPARFVDGGVTRNYLELLLGLSCYIQSSD